MKQEQLRALMTLANIQVDSLYELANQYWPDVPDYAERRRQEPWWLACTPAGKIIVGWRKRVIEISWADTKVEQVVTQDDVTKGPTMVHAYSFAKAVEYLTTLRRAIETHLETQVVEPQQREL